MGQLVPSDRELVQQALEACRSRPMSECSGEDSMEDLLAEGFEDIELGPSVLQELLTQDPPLSVMVAKVATISARVAARVAIARGFFAPGDEIVFGKYKNKHGIIERIWADDRGHPMIEIRPVPQGRKKNKIMGLYKVWHDEDPPDPEEEEK